MASNLSMASLCTLESAVHGHQTAAVLLQGEIVMKGWKKKYMDLRSEKRWVRPFRTFPSDRPMADFSGDHLGKRLDGVVLASDSSFVLVWRVCKLLSYRRSRPTQVDSLQLNSTQALYN
jgi:hypothetical protein